MGNTEGYNYSKPCTFNIDIDIDPIVLEKPTITQSSDFIYIYIYSQLHETILKAIKLPASTNIELA